MWSDEAVFWSMLVVCLFVVYRLQREAEKVAARSESVRTWFVLQATFWHCLYQAEASRGRPEAAEWGIRAENSLNLARLQVPAMLAAADAVRGSDIPSPVPLYPEGAIRAMEEALVAHQAQAGERPWA